jgi:hypothetical protein
MGATRWELSTPRATGHQLTGVTIDGQVRTIIHDAGGRVVTNGLETYTWHPTGQLATVSRNGVLVEA